ncbi:hypothetical protein B0T18DRAFT_205220 [Schizothecium vesticola]|uniref:Uncharacterized protein n=1 Tax=Schizothecium vesticola TaxID=314040 RepID=A0AA40JYL8_9PEZI|nr:hypothetical protein B0T18DRAFT_205220 [Schizothecium vesticola]
MKIPPSPMTPFAPLCQPSSQIDRYPPLESKEKRLSASPLEPHPAVKTKEPRAPVAKPRQNLPATPLPQK